MRDTLKAWAGFLLSGAFLIFASCEARALQFDTRGPKVEAERYNPTISLIVTFHDRVEDVAKLCHEAGAWPGLTLEQVLKAGEVGCSLWHPNSEHCTIHVMRPLRVDDRRTTILGHELLHCIVGRYHQPQ